MLLSRVSRGEHRNVPARNERHSRSPAPAGTHSRSSRRSRPGPGLLPPVRGPSGPVTQGWGRHPDTRVAERPSSACALRSPEGQQGWDGIEGWDGAGWDVPSCLGKQGRRAASCQGYPQSLPPPHPTNYRFKEAPGSCGHLR